MKLREASSDQFWNAGKSVGFTGSYDSNQLRLGIKIEMEHTTSRKIAEKIAKDHLSEPGMSDYYTRLIRMERKAKNGDKK